MFVYVWSSCFARFSPFCHPTLYPITPTPPFAPAVTDPPCELLVMFYYPPTPKFSPLPVPFPDTDSGFGSLLGGRATGKRECLVLGSLDSGAWSSRCVPHLSLEEVLPINRGSLES